MFISDTEVMVRLNAVRVADEDGKRTYIVYTVRPLDEFVTHIQANERAAIEKATIMAVSKTLPLEKRLQPAQPRRSVVLPKSSISRYWKPRQFPRRKQGPAPGIAEAPILWALTGLENLVYRFVCWCLPQQTPGR